MPKFDPATAETRVVNQAKRKATKAITRLGALMDSADARISLTACQAILERAFGKPGARLDASETAEPVAEVKRVIVSVNDLV